MNLVELLLRSRSAFAAKPVLIWDGEGIAFPVFEREIGRIANFLVGKGLRPGDRVVLLADNCPEWIESFFAVLYAGGVIVPINSALADSEVRRIIEHCGTHIVIGDDTRRAAVLPPDFEGAFIGLDANSSGANWHSGGGSNVLSSWVPRRNEDVAAIFYTSGTTGSPKGVVLSHGAKAFTVSVVQTQYHITSDDVSLICGPLAFIFHISINFLSSVSSGATAVLLPRFHPERVLRNIEAHRVTIMMGVPTMYQMMLNWSEDKQVDTRSLRICVGGGAAAPSTLVAGFKARFGVSLLDQWGMTECPMSTSFDPLLDANGKQGSCGRPMPWTRIRVVDGDGKPVQPGVVGEVVCQSEGLMTSYYRAEETTAAAVINGWMHSGDLGKMDEAGYLYIVGRKKDMIIRGGANIYPIDIEAALFLHPAVHDCAVVGVRDELFGEAVKAFIVLRAGHDADEMRIRAHCAAHLADYKIPSQVEFIDDLPKGVTGKILKHQLKSRAIPESATP